MGLYVEVMCDERKEWPRDGRFYSLSLRCHSDNADNPQGPTVAIAREEARKAKWIIRGRYACCPGCQMTEEEIIAKWKPR